MYSIVLMAALTTGGDVADFGRRGGRGCHGGGYAGCSCNGSYGGCCGCWGGGYGCWGGSYGCWGGGYGCCGGGYVGYGCSGGGYGCYGGHGCYGGYGCGGYVSYSTYNPTGTYYASGSAPVTYDTARAPGTGPGVATARAGRARLVVNLPAGARLTVNDTPTTQTSSRRVFTSPPLEAGKTYSYTLRAEVARDGQRLTTTRDVTVQAGRETDVSLSIPSGTVSARR